MRSSTSNSEQRPVTGPWLRTWVLTFAIVAVVLAGWEAALRQMGYRPTVVDDKTLWSIQRDRVYSENGERVIVLLGDCRMQLGVVPETLRKRLPDYRTVQLAVEQTSPIATLRDLAEDEQFDGTVVCAVNPRLLCRDLWDSQQAYVDHYHERYRFENGLHRRMSTWVQDTFAAVHPKLRLDDLVVHLVKEGRLPEPYHIEVEPDRTHRGDYSDVDLQAHQVYALGQSQSWRTGRTLPAPPKWLEDTREIERWVQAIQCRGGEVVFVRMPTTGALYADDQFAFPKQRYWDAFADQTSALCIHFKDWPQLASFDCPDLSHLDQTDAPQFTDELACILADQGVLLAPVDTLRLWAKADDKEPPNDRPSMSREQTSADNESADEPTDPAEQNEYEDEDDWPELPASIPSQG